MQKTKDYVTWSVRICVRSTSQGVGLMQILVDDVKVKGPQIVGTAFGGESRALKKLRSQALARVGSGPLCHDPPNTLKLMQGYDNFRYIYVLIIQKYTNFWIQCGIQIGVPC